MSLEDTFSSAPSMSYLPLPRLKKDRTAGTFYQTLKYVRYWDGKDLCCEHQIVTTKKCGKCACLAAAAIRESELAAAAAIQVSKPVPVSSTTVTVFPSQAPKKPIETAAAAVSGSIIPGVNTSAVGKIYEVIRLLGGGSFGEIYLGKDNRDGKYVAMKVEQRDTRYPQLASEYALYRALKPAIGIPQVYWMGSNSKVHIVVMELLGQDLQQVSESLGGKLPLSVVNKYACQLLTLLEHFHGQGYLHRDLKPENLMLGRTNETKDTVYLVDFGLAKQWRLENGKHIPYRKNKALIGTPRYCSIFTHEGLEASRRDDLESLAYILIYLVKGRLPWQGIKAANKQEKYDGIHQVKKSYTPAKICEGLPPAYENLLTTARSLIFAQTPDYASLRTLFA